MDLSFSVIEGYADSGKVVKEGLFSRDMDEEDQTDQLLDDLDSGRIEIEDALRVTIELHHNNPENLETCGFLGNLFWKAGMPDEAAEIYEAAYKWANKLIPKGFKGKIDWLHLDNRPFLRVAHGYLLSLLHAQDGRKAKALANKLLRWSPHDNLGVRFLVPDIDFISGDFATALKAYINLAEEAPVNWYPAALCMLRTGNYVEACTYLRKGILGNPYVAEGLTGRRQLDDHIYWHGSNLNGTDLAIEYLQSPVNVWTHKELDFVDWVFNSSDVLSERAAMTAIREALTYEHDIEIRRECGQRMDALLANTDAALSMQMVRKVRNRWGDSIWPWDREGFLVPTAMHEDYSKRRVH